MKKSFLMPVIGGAILGSILFFAGPALFFFLCVVFTLKFIFTPFGMRRSMMMYGIHRPYWRAMSGWQNADIIRNMSDEEYTAYKSKMQSAYGYANCCYSAGYTSGSAPSANSNNSSL